MPTSNFNPRTPCGVRPCAAACRRRRGPDFNPRTPCGVRPARFPAATACSYFNPRTPCGVRRKNDGNWRGEQRFQSTHPVRGATWQERARSTSRHNFNPRTPCGVRRWIRLLLPGTTNFNPRAPCGARLFRQMTRSFLSGFQSTRPVWGATRRESMGAGRDVISIHAPRVGRDKKAARFRGRGGNFNPRAPCGARRSIMTKPLPII